MSRSETREQMEAVALTVTEWRSVLNVLRASGVRQLESGQVEMARELKRLHSAIETQVQEGVE